MRSNKKKIVLLIGLVVSAVFLLVSGGCSSGYENASGASPDKKINVDFFLNGKGQPAYKVTFNSKVVIDTSTMGFAFKGQPDLSSNMGIVSVEQSSANEKWAMDWGEQDSVLNNYNELKIGLEEKEEPNRKFNVVFKVYNDGVGFRYEFPKQDNLDSVVIMAENTEFQLTGDHKCWWIPGDWEIYEHLYKTTRLSEIDAIAERGKKLAQTYIPYNAVNTPVTMKTDDGLYLSFHEANLTNYSEMTLLVDTNKLKLTSGLVGSKDESKVKISTPFVTPWRTIQIAEHAGDLIESKMIVNLNEPNVLGDVSWVKPMKYVGIWWEMHLRKSTWDIEEGKVHGATTENAKRYIDFAAKNDIKGFLAEGWNVGWGDDEGPFDFVTPYPDFDLDEVAAYAKSKGIEMIMHHETYAKAANYESHIDSAFSLMDRLGIKAVKTGYVGSVLPEGEYHHGQWMVNHYRRVVQKAAEHHIMVDVHEPIKPTGIRRTYPNMLSREGLRGQEWNAWSSGNPPNHLTIVPFTRMLGGPIDFTPGIFDVTFDFRPKSQVHTTITKQLALFVVIYSPVQMAADLPENYEGHPAFQFIRDVPVDWQETKVLNGEIGEYVTIARKDKHSNNWFLGSITNEEGRTENINLNFLDADKIYRAVIYKDGKDADWDKNPKSYQIETREVTSKDSLEIVLAPGGGAAVSFFAI